MASVNVTIDANALLQQLHIEIDTALIGRLAQLLGLTPDEARDWLIYRVAQFRGISETDAQALFVVPDPTAPADPTDMQSQARGPRPNPGRAQWVKP